MATDSWIDGRADWNTAADWSAGVPTATSNVDVGEGDPQITSAITIASLIDSAAVTFADAGAGIVSGGVDVSGGLSLLDTASGQGGSSLTIGGALTNSGLAQFGNKLSATDTVSAASLDNPNTLDFFGGGTASRKMLLDIAGTAGIRDGGRAHGRGQSFRLFRDRVWERRDHIGVGGVADAERSERVRRRRQRPDLELRAERPQ
jgi:hypothetical protein